MSPPTLAVFSTRPVLSSLFFPSWFAVHVHPPVAYALTPFPTCFPPSSPLVHTHTHSASNPSHPATNTHARGRTHCFPNRTALCQTKRRASVWVSAGGALFSEIADYLCCAQLRAQGQDPTQSRQALASLNELLPLLTQVSLMRCCNVHSYRHIGSFPVRLLSSPSFIQPESVCSCACFLLSNVVSSVLSPVKIRCFVLSVRSLHSMCGRCILLILLF